jgi:hypothetical protein
MKPSPSEGFKYLLEFGMGDMTAESIIMRNKSLFDGIVVEKARNRLEKYGIAVPGETPE